MAYLLSRIFKRTKTTIGFSRINCMTRTCNPEGGGRTIRQLDARRRLVMRTQTRVSTEVNAMSKLMTRSRRFGALAVGIGALVAVGGLVAMLGGSSTPVAAGASGDADSTISDTDQVSPLAELLYGDSYSSTAAVRRETAIEACMTQHGYGYVPALLDSRMLHEPGTPGVPGTIAELRAFRSHYGYGITTQPQIDTQSEKDANDKLFESMTAEQRLGWKEAYGTDATGCRAQGLAAQITTSPKPGQAERGLSRVLRDEGLAAANRNWSGCMAQEGFSGLNSSDDARIFVRNSTGGPNYVSGSAESQRLEVAVAQADLDCWVRYVAAVRHSVERELIAAG